MESVKTAEENSWPYWVFGGLVVLAIALLLASARYRDSSSSAVSGDMVKNIQGDVVKADGAEGYYAKTYRYSEPGYWSQIAGWVVGDAIQAGTDKHPYRHVLDIGCGYGTLLAFVSSVTGAEGTCMDAMEYLKAPVRDKYRLKFVMGDIERDALPEPHPDAVLMTEVLEHFNFQPVPTLRRIHEALNPGGRFYLSTPDAKTWGRVHIYNSLAELPAYSPKAERVDGHIWVYSQDELEGVLRQAGFTIERLATTTVEGRTHFNITARK